MYKRWLYVTLAGFILTFIMACKERSNPKQNESESKSNENLPQSDPIFNHGNMDRDIWQKPNIITKKLGDITTLTIVDIGAGTGYFSLRLAQSAAKVIAVEIEPQLISYIDSLRNKLPEDKRNRLTTRLASPSIPNLEEDEADIILIINTIAYLPNLPVYLNTLKKSLKKDGILIIVDYKMKRLPIDVPPRNERIYLDKLEDLLIGANYKLIESDDTSLDYQYIVKASNIK